MRDSRIQAKVEVERRRTSWKKFEKKILLVRNLLHKSLAVCPDVWLKKRRPLLSRNRPEIAQKSP
jgi:hypothetical protein